MPPISILIKPASSLCNMRCEYCFYADEAKRRNAQSYGMMSEDTGENIIRSALDYATGSVSFAFQGGEPTLRGLDFFKGFVDFAKANNTKKLQINYSIQTNGYILDEEWARFFADNNFLVGISLDGNKDIHDKHRLDNGGRGTFQRVIAACRILDRFEAQYNILSVITEYSARSAHKIYNFYKKNGFKYLQFIPCIDGFDEEKSAYSLSNQRYASFFKTMFDLWEQDLKRGDYVSVRHFDNYVALAKGYPAENCAMNGVCGRYFTVEGDGSVFPCDFYCLDEWKIGNINTQSFEEIASSPKISEFIKLSEQSDNDCHSCKFYALCRGGCKRDREPELTRNKYCKALKEFFNYTADRIYVIAQKL